MQQEGHKLDFLYGQSQVDPVIHEQKEANIIQAIENEMKERPGYIEAAEILADFHLAKSANEKETKKDEIVRRAIRQFFKDPKALENMHDHWNVMGVLNGKSAEDLDDLESRIQKLLVDVIQKEKLGMGGGEKDVALMARWLELYVQNEQCSGKVEKFFSAFFDGVKSPATYITRLHTIAEALLDIRDKQVTDKGISLLAGETPIVNKDPKDLGLYAYCLYDVENDNNVRKALDVDAVFNYLCNQCAAEKKKVFLGAVGKTLDKQLKDDGSAISQLVKRCVEDPVKQEKMDALHKMNDTQDENGTIRYEILGEGKTHFTYPLDLIADPEKMSRLRRKLNRRQSETMYLGGRRRVNAYVPDVAETVVEFDDDDDINKEVRSWFDADVADDKRNIFVDSIFDTVGMLFSEMGDEQRKELFDKLLILKHDLKDNLKRLVSPAGDCIIIKDEYLNKLGISQIIIKPTTSFLELDVNIVVGNFSCHLHLDNDFSLRNTKSHRPLEVSIDSYLKVAGIVLPHVRSLLCGDTRSASKKTGGGNIEQGGGKGSAIYQRRPHIRKLPPGSGYTLEQMAFVFREYGIDLEKYNRERKLTRDTGQFTFVSEVDEMSTSWSGGVGTGANIPPVETEIKGGGKLLSDVLRDNAEIS